jgi:ubiquinone/menaquinone biosynthesis C-methylase UbiE
MRVPDVGTGAGDVAFLVAELVGVEGEVVGVDRSIATARARADARSLGKVSFREGDPATMSFDQPFDAVVGRRFLQFQADPAAMLRALAGHEPKPKRRPESAPPHAYLVDFHYEERT